MIKKEESFQELEIFPFLYFISLNLRRAEAGPLPLNARIKISSVAHHELPHHGLRQGLTLLLSSQHRASLTNTALGDSAGLGLVLFETNELISRKSKRHHLTKQSGFLPASCSLLLLHSPTSPNPVTPPMLS